MAKSPSQQIKEYAYSIGIDLIGITSAGFDEDGEQRLHDFIEEKRHGNMKYLEDYKKRVTPELLLPGAKSVIVIAINYYRETDPLPAGHGRIARYAYGRDYHKVLKSLLKKLANFIEQRFADSSGDGSNSSAMHEIDALIASVPLMLPRAKQVICKICVDSSPLLEKSYAEKAGLGFIGKNTTLITPEFGSFVLLGEILTTLELEYDTARPGTCGTCTRCIDACPTQAIVAPGKLDARRCISYLTIEEKGPIPHEFHKSIGNLIFGCDICQEVCPYNKQNAKPIQLKAFQEVKIGGPTGLNHNHKSHQDPLDSFHEPIAGASISVQEIIDMKTDEEFLKRFAGSPVMRAKRKGLIRNAQIVKANGQLIDK